MHIHVVLTLAPFLFCPMSSVINRDKTWLNVVIEKRDVLLAGQHISWFYMLGFPLSLFNSTSGYEFSEANMSNSE